MYDRMPSLHTSHPTFGPPHTQTVGDNQKKEKRAAEKSNTIEIPSQVLLAILYF